MSNKETFDKILDALIDEALPIVESMPDKDLPEEKPIPHPEEFEKHLANIFAKERRKIKRAKLFKYTRRVAACLVICMIALGVTVMSVSALRVRVLNMIFNTHQTNTDIRVVDPEEENASDTYAEDEVAIEYIPEGFTLEKRKIFDKSIYLQFRKDALYFKIDIRDLNGFGSVDTENADKETITINNWSALYSENDNVKTISFHDENYIYFIDGILEKEELIRIAQGVKKN